MALYLCPRCGNTRQSTEALYSKPKCKCDGSVKMRLVNGRKRNISKLAGGEASVQVKSTLHARRCEVCGRALAIRNRRVNSTHGFCHVCQANPPEEYHCNAPLIKGKKLCRRIRAVDSEHCKQHQLNPNHPPRNQS